MEQPKTLQQRQTELQALLATPQGRVELENLDEESQGLRSVVRSHVVTEVAVEDESVIWNLNDPDAYAAARARA